MNKKTLISSITAACISVLAVSGIAYAASIDATSKLGGNSGDFFTFDGTGTFGSVKIGKQGTGGVTFFNGTIINETTSDGDDNPVTFGDNVRIDGTVWRGDEAGPGGGVGPFTVNDDLVSTGSVTAGGDVTQGTSNEGVLKGWAHVGSGGTLIKGYNVDSVSKTATGTYNVTFTFDPSERVYQVTPSGSSDDTVAIRFAGAVSSATSNTVRVRTYEEGGTTADSVFMLAVY